MTNQPLPADLVREMEEALREARDIYTWMTGSSDFGEGGMAEAGWKKTDPNRKQIDAVIAKLDALRKPPDPAEEGHEAWNNCDSCELGKDVNVAEAGMHAMAHVVKAYAPLLAQHDQEREGWKKKEEAARVLSEHLQSTQLSNATLTCSGSCNVVQDFRTAFGWDK